MLELTFFAEFATFSRGTDAFSINGVTMHVRGAVAFLLAILTKSASFTGQVTMDTRPATLNSLFFFFQERTHLALADAICWIARGSIVTFAEFETILAETTRRAY